MSIFTGKKYDPIECSLMSKALSDDIKQQVKALNFKRYIQTCLSLGHVL